MENIVYRFPLTKTGYILSTHCSPFVSGLVIEIAKEKHGIVNDKRILDFTNDPNYEMMRNAARRVGFMLDRNAPWRFVFNVASGGLATQKQMITEEEDGQIIKKVRGHGGQFFMNKYGVTFSRSKSAAPVDETHPLSGTEISNHLFDQYYRKTHLDEIENIKKYMFLFYSSYFNQFSTFSKLETYSCQTALEYNTRLRVKYVNRKQLPGQDPRYAGTNVLIPEVFQSTYKEDFWLRFILRFRLLETKQHYSDPRLTRTERDMLAIYNAIGKKAALNYINDLTKGLHDTKFVHEGKYWHGQRRAIYEKRKSESLSRAGEKHNDEITAVLNEIK
jgi:hypothetical protein